MHGTSEPQAGGRLSRRIGEAPSSRVAHVGNLHGSNGDYLDTWPHAGMTQLSISPKRACTADVSVRRASQAPRRSVFSSTPAVL